ncbi:universal stress protein [Antrihabitans sp. YC2-6]|uniref:universal stress protein n=1 Tax=Antrihabitans sp. YC2-6 TaxID=2799498 RepID=UPI0018F72A96|nr:universal stress protein [Antrihabitans sp. YC2-6]MBJ8345227.1 universal stress protein [Antrihabitans sp. YC2-6]
MSVIVGYQPDQSGADALELGAGVALALHVDLVLAIATPKPWTTPSSARIDAEFAEYAQRYGDHAESAARSQLERRAPGLGVTVHRTAGKTAAKALLEVVSGTAGDILVVGGNSDSGRMKLGATTGRLLHSSSIPLALAPPGYVCSAITRVTCAYSGDQNSEQVVAAARDLAERMAVPLRVATFGVRPAEMFPPEVGMDIERNVLAAWQEQMAAGMAKLKGDGVIGADTPTALSIGGDWDDALARVEWAAGDIIAIGTTPREPVKRVFLGSRAAKIIAAAQVPALIFPG